jgi:opacity protein-like surface antigen
MTAKKVVQSLIVTAALCLSTTSVHAQGYRLFIMGADSSLTDARTFTEGHINYNSFYAGGAKATAGLEIPFYKIFGIEVSYGIGSNNLEVNQLGYPYTLIKAYSVRYSRVSGDIVLHVPGSWKGIRAYGLAGVEYDLFAPTSHAQTLAVSEGFAYSPSAKLASQGQTGYNIGGGLDHKVTSRVDLRLDARYHIFGSPTYGLPQGATTNTAPYFPIGGSAHDTEYSIGLVYRFGKSK